ncbi:MAG: ABC transporter permease, partial [Brucella intermedia]
MRIERRETRPVALVATAPVIAVLAAFVLAGLLIAAAGAPVLESFRQIAIGAFGNKLSITETLARATPLMLTGLAAAVAFRSKLWNIGAEGQFYMGALAVVACGTQLQLPAAVLIPLLLIVGAIAGMIFLL